MASIEQTSSFYSPNYGLEKLMTRFQITFEGGDTIYRMDALSKLARIVKRISKYTPYTYEGWESLTTMCYQIYGNTTTVHIVLMYNGLHRLELVPGRILKFPDLGTLNSQLTQNTQINNIGKTVTI